ncbi:hypothetical protein MMC22_008703 [Lobaria immixta]|nr:hypothetical protein [Lobaria immixta]
MSGLSQKSSIDTETLPPYRLHEPDHGQGSSSRNVKETTEALENDSRTHNSKMEGPNVNGPKAFLRRLINGPSPPPITERRLGEAINEELTSAIQLAVAKERVRSLEEQLEEAKKRIEEEKAKGEAERARGERAVAEERNRGEQALVKERKWGRDQVRVMFDRGAFTPTVVSEDRRWGTFTRRNLSV